MLKYLLPIILALGLSGCGTQSYPLYSGTYIVEGNTTLPATASLEIDTVTTTVTMHDYRADTPLIVVHATVLDEEEWVEWCQTNFSADKLETWKLTSDQLTQTLYLSAGCGGAEDVLLRENIDPTQSNRFVLFKKKSNQ